MPVIVFGSAIADVIFRLPALPRPGETVIGQAGVPVPGGKGLNQAVAAARDGAEVRFFGCVGDDAAGAMLRATLVEAGIDVVGLRHTAEPSGLAFVCVDAAGQNQIAVSPGANASARAAQLQAIPRDATILMQMEVTPAQNALLIARGREAGARIVLNLAPADALDRNVLGALDLLIMNENEAAWLGRQLGREADALALHEVLGIGVAVTKAERGAELATHTGVLKMPAFPVRVLDSTGAGDAWCGVLVAALDRGMPMDVAMRRANAAGALACTRAGAAPSMPTSSEIASLMRETPRLSKR